MKKTIYIIAAVLLAVSCLCLSACETKKDDTKSTSATETTTQATAETTSATDTSELQTYLDGFIKGDSPIYGVWKLEYMTVIFRNDDLAELVMGTEGYFSKYKLDEKEGTLTVQLLPNTIDGIYAYEFSEDENTLTLTLDGKTLTLERESGFSMIPEAPKKPEIDETILGWWDDGEGTSYWFGDNGIMYCNAIARETCYTYSASNGKIKAVYTYGGELEENLTYKIKGENLVIDGVKFSRK